LTLRTFAFTIVYRLRVSGVYLSRLKKISRFSMTLSGSLVFLKRLKSSLLTSSSSKKMLSLTFHSIVRIFSGVLNISSKNMFSSVSLEKIFLDR
jgi:hypothetical protein